MTTKKLIIAAVEEAIADSAYRGHSLVAETRAKIKATYKDSAAAFAFLAPAYAVRFGASYTVDAEGAFKWGKRDGKTDAARKTNAAYMRLREDVLKAFAKPGDGDSSTSPVARIVKMLVKLSDAQFDRVIDKAKAARKAAKAK